MEIIKDRLRGPEESYLCGEIKIRKQPQNINTVLQSKACFDKSHPSSSERNFQLSEFGFKNSK